MHINAIGAVILAVWMNYPGVFNADIEPVRGTTLGPAALFLERVAKHRGLKE